MNGLLAIAETFLDRMTNPQYGAEANDQYSLRFHQLLIEDRQFADSFANLALAPEDVESLPVCAWPWYLQWRAEHAAPPSVDFLNALFDSTDDPAVRLAVMQSAHSGRSDPTPDDSGTAPASMVFSDETEERRPSGAELERRQAAGNRWLRSRVNRITGDPAQADMELDEVATYLLQLGDPASLASLRRLLADQPGLRQTVRDTIARHLADAGFDPRGADAWRAQQRLT